MTSDPLRALDLTLRRRLDALLPGEHDGLRLGPGSEREEVAMYRTGDDVRRIDWNITARAGDLHVWRPRAENRMDCQVLLDLSPSMAFGTTVREKKDLSAEIVAALARLIDAPGNRLGALAVTPDGFQWYRADSPRVAASRIIRAVGAADHRTGDTPSLATAMTAFARHHRQPGLRIVISDFMDPDDLDGDVLRWRSPLRQLAARHDVIAVEVTDPREMTLPDVGVVTLVDPESGRQRQLWTSDPAIRDRYAAAAAEFRGRIARSIATSGADHLVVDTGRDWIRDLGMFLRARTRRRGRR